MYFPYLRGRQYELLALRELAERNLIGNKIIPILEPIKFTSTLLKTIQMFIKKNKKLAIVLNPGVGYLKNKIIKKNCEDSDIARNIIDLIENENIIKSYIINDTIVKLLKEDENKYNYLIINPDRDCLDNYLDIYDNSFPLYSVIPQDRAFNRIIEKNKILLEDKFDKQPRNIDYTKNVDKFFSDTIISFKEDGYDGFADYSIVGEEYNESGFAPIAVAIHLIYLASNNNELRIHHFVSDSNDSIEDPAGKFGEAVEKLISWCDDKNISKTKGLDYFYDCYNTGKYPGLGVAKKYSIMHHIELVSNFLEGKYL